MDEKRRPVSVTVIAWILMVTSAWSLVILPVTFRMAQVQQFYEALGVSLALVLVWGVVANAITLLFVSTFFFPRVILLSLIHI